MSEETQLEQSADTGELAQFHEQEQEPSRRSLTVDKAYEHLQERKDQAKDEAAIAQQDDEPEQAESAAEDAESGDRALWSNEDAQTIALYQQEAARFQQDLAAFQQAQQQIDLNEIAKKDRERATALRTQMREAEQELRERYETLAAVERDLQHKAQAHQHKQAQKVVDREKEKLSEKVPDLDREALTRYLTSEMGFTREEVSQAYDHRLVVMAEKARRYDELMEDKKGKKVPKLKKGKRKSQRQDTSGWHEAMDEINRTGITKHNAHRVLHSPAPKKGEPTVKELRRRLKKTGSINDAYALLQAKKRAQA